MENEKEKRKQSYKDYSELTFTDDFMFCKVMSSDPDLCRRVAETVIGRKISKIGNITIQNTISPDAESKGVRFDVYFEDEEGTLYDIEMQTAGQGDLPKRIHYYQALMDLDSLDKGDDYNQLRKTCIVFICLFDAFGKGLPQYTFTEKCREYPELSLNDGTEKVFFCATKQTALNTGSEEQGAFLGYLLGKSSEEKIVFDLARAVERAKRRESWRKEYMTLEEIKAKEFIEGLARGREEGREVGREEGLLTGLARGREEGVINMLKGMLVSFKEEELPWEFAYKFISRNPECQSMSFEEIRDIWDGLS